MTTEYTGIRYFTCCFEPDCERAKTFLTEKSDRAYTEKIGRFRFGKDRHRDNDTSVIRGPATMKAGRLEAYGTDMRSVV